MRIKCPYTFFRTLYTSTPPDTFEFNQTLMLSSLRTSCLGLLGLGVPFHKMASLVHGLRLTEHYQSSPCIASTSRSGSPRW